MRVDLYHPNDRADWDDFITRSKNGTFLFLRGYMDYHNDRFCDFSLVSRDDTDRIISVLPAHRDGDRVISHGGLTYGGFISDERMKTNIMLDVFAESLRLLQSCDVEILVYKTIPHIYHRAAAEEDLYALFLADAQLTRCDVLAVAFRDGPLPWQQRRRRMMQRARQTGVDVRVTTDLEPFWEILTANLLSRHGRLPVHSLAEISLLRERFPEFIKLFGAFEGDRIIAGTVIYETDRVAHAQYTASDERGKEVGALDLLFHVLMTEAYREKPYFDFGVSSEDGGRHLNRGLMDQKEGFGARLIAHKHYEIDLKRWSYAEREV